MKIHQQKIIRSQVEFQRDYQLYRDDLQRDFHHVCGYCGKTEQITKRAFEIDHFVPKRLDGDRISDYTNLVYSCFNCNRKKGGKFPTEDKTKSYDSDIGIIDPVTDEFEKNIERADTGEIIGITPLGRYVCEEIFKFHQRPMRQIWLAMQIKEKKQQIRDKYLSGYDCDEDVRVYMEIDQMIEEIEQLLFAKGE